MKYVRHFLTLQKERISYCETAGQFEIRHHKNVAEKIDSNLLEKNFETEKPN